MRKNDLVPKFSGAKRFADKMLEKQTILQHQEKAAQEQKSKSVGFTPKDASFLMLSLTEFDKGYFRWLLMHTKEQRIELVRSKRMCLEDEEVIEALERLSSAERAALFNNEDPMEKRDMDKEDKDFLYSLWTDEKFSNAFHSEDFDTDPIIEAVRRGDYSLHPAIEPIQQGICYLSTEVFPMEMLFFLFEKLDLKSIGRMGRTCKQMSLVCDHFLFKDIEQRLAIPSGLTLSNAQIRVVWKAICGQSMFITGAAGSGKSMIIPIIKENLQRRGLTTQVTASTGLAACNIGGITLHMFAGVGIEPHSDQNPYYLRVLKRQAARARWCWTSCLIIDEISMTDGTFFSDLDQLARKIHRRYDLPFGGMQVIAIGDFYQLPPVPGRTTSANGQKIIKIRKPYCFEVSCWDELFRNRCYYLPTIFRQRDEQLTEILKEVRDGFIAPANKRLLNKLVSSVPPRASDGYVHLWATHANVDEQNQKELNLLTTFPVYGYTASDMPKTGRNGDYETTQSSGNFPVKASICLRKDARVMLRYNASDELKNGSVGNVVAFAAIPLYLWDALSGYEGFFKGTYAPKIFGLDVVPCRFKRSTPTISKMSRMQAIQHIGVIATASTPDLHPTRALGGGGVYASTGLNQQQSTIDHMTPPDFDFFIDLKPHGLEAEMLMLNEDEGLLTAEMRKSSEEILEEFLNEPREERPLQEDFPMMYAKQITSRSQMDRADVLVFPIVQFDSLKNRQVPDTSPLPPGSCLVLPHLWQSEMVRSDRKTGEKTCEIVDWRYQIPLEYAWAMTIHKSQGTSIEKAYVDLGKVFEHGQGYVALSRMTSLGGVVLSGFDATRITTDPLVKQFYEQRVTYLPE